MKAANLDFYFVIVFNILRAKTFHLIPVLRDLNVLKPLFYSSGHLYDSHFYVRSLK